MSSCQTFRNRLGKIQGEPLAKLLEAFASSSTETEERALTKALEQLGDQKAEFVKEYQEKTKDLIVHWFRSLGPDTIQAFKDSITFEENTQRVIFKGNLGSYFDPFDYFPSIIKGVEGNLFLHGDLKQADYLEYITGNFKASDPNLSSLSRLKTVGNDLTLTGSQVTNLNSLVTVGNDLSIKNSPLESLPSLEVVGGDFDADGSYALSSIPKLRLVGRTLTISNTSIRSLEALEIVRENLNTGRSPLVSIPNLIEIGGCLIVRPTVKNLPNFTAQFPKLKRIGDFEGVSVYVPTIELKIEIENLKKAGMLFYDGSIQIILS